MKNNLKVLRAMHSITQSDLAGKLSVSRQTVNAIETGRFNPSTLLALKISRVFGVGVNDIFELEDGE